MHNLPPAPSSGGERLPQEADELLELELKKTELMEWLREHPDADDTSRFEIIGRLRDVNDKLLNKKSND